MSELPAWAAQLAGVLPLAVLLAEFIDAPAKLHSLELAAAVPLWNWPITPAMARTLLASDNNLEACCLDSGKRCLTFHCIDGRYGDIYPCSTPVTSRLCAETRSPATVISNGWLTTNATMARRQNLKVITLTKRLDQPQPRHAVFCSTYLVTSMSGWLCWTGAIITSSAAGLYVAAAYLALMPLTGTVVGFTHGQTPRRLRDNRLHHERMVLATDSVNGNDWYAFYGDSVLLNSLLNRSLNRPLSRLDSPPAKRLLTKMLLRFFIVSQWLLSVGSCAVRDWNAIIIVSWLMFCGLYSVYMYPLRTCIQDWLKYTCNIGAKSVHVVFSSRRSMLSALVYLNPDSKEKRTKWIDPILCESDDRTMWETTLLNYMLTKRCDDESIRGQYWWRFIEEGYEMGGLIKDTIQRKMALGV